MNNICPNNLVVLYTYMVNSTLYNCSQVVVCGKRSSQIDPTLALALGLGIGVPVFSAFLFAFYKTGMYKNMACYVLCYERPKQEKVRREEEKIYQEKLMNSQELRDNLEYIKEKLGEEDFYNITSRRISPELRQKLLVLSKSLSSICNS